MTTPFGACDSGRAWPLTDRTIKMAPSEYQFVIYRDKDNEFRWYLWNHLNRKKIAASGEGFTRRDDCERSANLVKSVAYSAPVLYAQNAS